MAKPISPTDVAWVPSQQYAEQSSLFRFMQKHGIGDLTELYRRAREDPAWFWQAVERDLDLEWFAPYSQVLDVSRGVPWARWFVGGRLNMAHNCLDRHVLRGAGQRTALIWEGEDGSIRSLTYSELLGEVNRLASGLKKLGAGKGDRVGIFMPMLLETVVACLACMRIGAIFIPIFSGYGPEAVATRLADCGAKLLFTADGFWRRGRRVDMKQVADRAVELAGCVERVVVVRRFPEPLDVGPRDLCWDDVVAGQPPQCPAEETAADDPFMIIYTSGTTGKPKGTVHVHTGFPLKAAQDLSHCFDIQPGDILFWVTDMGWMMGPWAFLGTLLLRGTLLLYEGAQDYPHPGRLWELVDRHGVNILGLSPTSIRALMAAGGAEVERYPMVSLRVLGSTGEPWNPEPWQWYFEKVGHGRCPIINYSGGTEVSGGILGCFPITPIKPCSFAGPIPGMDADVVDETGHPVRGAVGELVIKSPWPGMTQGFWNAPERYLETYWSRWPNVWVHGDLAYIDADGFWYILGRSDDTIKVAGKRVGPAEVESALVAHPAVREAAAIGVPDAVKGEVLVCFAVLNPDFAPGEGLKRELVQAVEERMGKSLRPEEIHFVPDLPKTRNAKILRRVIRATYLGHDPGDLSSVENPQAMEGLPVIQRPA